MHVYIAMDMYIIFIVSTLKVIKSNVTNFREMRKAE